MAELCQPYALHPSQIKGWKNLLLGRTAQLLDKRAAPDPGDLAPLHAQIGQQVLELEAGAGCLEQRADQGGIAERKQMIEREHAVSITQQTQVLGQVLA